MAMTAPAEEGRGTNPTAGDWSARRRTLAWVNVSLQSALLLVLLVFVNLIAHKSARRYDLTSVQAFALSGITEDTLRNLDYDLQTWLTADEYNLRPPDPSMSIAWQRTSDLMDEMKQRTPRLRFGLATEGNKTALDELNRHWSGGVSPNTLYLLATYEGGRTAKRVIDLAQLYEGDSKTGEIRRFRGETVLVNALKELSISTRQVIYETQGHQEMLTPDVRTVGLVGQFMSLNEGVEFRRLDTLAARSIPDDCSALMIVGPSNPFSDAEVQVIRDYLDRGGNLFAALRPRTLTGLEKLLEENGIKVGKETIILDPGDFVPPAWNNVRVRRFYEHEVNRGLSNAPIALPDCTTVEPVEKGPGWMTLPVAKSSSQSWGEKGAIGAGTKPKPDVDEPAGELTLILAVERPATKSSGKGKIIVWGSAQALTIEWLRTNPVQLQYIANNFRWLMGRQLVVIPPNELKQSPLNISPAQLAKLKWVVLLGFPSLGVVLGIMVWFFRRK
jgi:hypothetical protein